MFVKLKPHERRYYRGIRTRFRTLYKPKVRYTTDMCRIDGRIHIVVWLKEDLDIPLADWREDLKNILGGKLEFEDFPVYMTIYY